MQHNEPVSPRQPGERTSARDLYRKTRRAALGALIVTLGLGVAKLLGGWLGNSLALLSDSVHSFGDALSSASILAALWWAERPADREHPYGHTRIETIVASNVAVLLFLSGIWIVWEAISEWDVPGPVPHWSTLIIASVSVVLNEAYFRYSIKIARQTESKAIEVSAWDLRIDVFGSLVVLVGLAATTWGGPRWHSMDHAAALVVAGLIFWAGGTLFWSSLQELMDRQAEPAMLQKVRDTARKVVGVCGIEKLLVRKSGLEYFVDIHVEVDSEISVREGHRIGHEVKDHLMSNLAAVKDVLVHIEPYQAGGQLTAPARATNL